MESGAAVEQRPGRFLDLPSALHSKSGASVEGQTCQVSSDTNLEGCFVGCTTPPLLHLRFVVCACEKIAIARCLAFAAALCTGPGVTARCGPR